MGEAEDQGQGGWKGANNRGANLAKTGLVGEIDQGEIWTAEDQGTGRWDQGSDRGE